jgi:hypothetical protein
MSDTQSTTGRAAAARGALGTLLLGLTAGCASTSDAGASAYHASSPRPAAPAVPQPVSAYHTTATALARQVTGCDPHPLSRHSAAQRLRLPDARDVASAVACTLRGRTALILTFTGRAEQGAVEGQLRDRVAYYATGPGWSAAPSDTSERVGQQSVVQDVALALGGLVETGGA